MFAGDRAAPGDDLREKFVQSRLGAPGGTRLSEIHHYVGVDVAVTGMAETRDGQTVFLLKSDGESEKVFQPAARDNNVFIEFGEAGVAKGVGKLTTDFPDVLAFGGPQTVLNKKRFLPAHNSLHIRQLAPDGLCLPIEFNNQMGTATAQAAAFRALISSRQREFVRQFEGTGQKSDGTTFTFSYALGGAGGRGAQWHQWATEAKASFFATDTIDGNGHYLDSLTTNAPGFYASFGPFIVT